MPIHLQVSRYLLLCVVLLSIAGNCQSPPQSAEAKPLSNLALVYRLIDSSLAAAVPNSFNSRYVTLSLPSNAAVLENHIRGTLSAGGGADTAKLNYTIEHVSLRYAELFRDGFLGDYYFIREVKLKGSIGVQRGADFSMRQFDYVSTDTVALGDKTHIENTGYDITSAELPAEPVFESLFEPVAAVGAMAVTVYLLFTVRKTN